MKYRGIFEYEYPTEHKPPVSIDVHLHGDCVKGKIIEWEYMPPEQEPCEDAISRQAVLNIIDSDWKYEGMEEYINELPPVTPQPKTGHWIPVSERMPEEHEWMGTKKFGTTISDEVYVMLENSEGRRYTQHLSFQNGKLSTADQSRLDAIFKGGTPIAWMPLPKPYKPQERSDKE